MSHAFDPTRRAQIALAPESLHALHAALSADLGTAAATYLQEAGYATGVGHAATMGEWLGERGEGAPQTLRVAAFERRVTEFFRDLGWGDLALDTGHGAITVIDAYRWAESAPEGMERQGCHFSTGMLAGFFGTLANHPLAVLEVEPVDSSSGACRFLMGNAGVLEHVFEQVSSGATANDAVATLT